MTDDYFERRYTKTKLTRMKVPVEIEVKYLRCLDRFAYEYGDAFCREPIHAQRETQHTKTITLFVCADDTVTLASHRAMITHHLMQQEDAQLHQCPVCYECFDVAWI